MKQTKNGYAVAKKSSSKAKFSSRRGFSKIHLLILLAAFATIGLVYTLASHAATGDGSIGVYRLFQGASGEHLLTTSEVEKNALVPKAGFSSEGFGFSAWADGNNGRKPVYRLAGPGTNGKHLLTMSLVEKDALVKGGWKLEGVAFYAYDAAAAGRIPVYRLSAANGDHLLTASGFEKDDLSKKGYSYEGIAFYVSDGVNSSTPVQNTHLPSGALDQSSCSTLAGWALDGDNINSAVRVDAYIQGVGIASGATNVPRADITKIFYAPGNHGYNYKIPAKWLDGKAHWADVYAINLDSKGQTKDGNTQIGHREFACDAAGKDYMPEINAQRAAEAAAAAKKAEEAAKAAQVNNPGGPSWPSTPGAVPLGRGTTGLGVLGLQTKLGKVGFWLAADGNFGATTEWAVKAFQIEIGLPYNGVADGQTQEVLQRAVNDGWRFNPNDPLLSNIPPLNNSSPAPTPTPSTPNNGGGNGGGSTTTTTTSTTGTTSAPADPPPAGVWNEFIKGKCTAYWKRSLFPSYSTHELGNTTPRDCKAKAYFLRYTQPADKIYDHADWISPGGAKYEVATFHN